VKAVQSKVGLCASNGPHSSATARAKIFSEVQAPGSPGSAAHEAREPRERMKIQEASWANMRKIYRLYRIYYIILYRLSFAKLNMLHDVVCFVDMMFGIC
jgi:hypothetical protein